VGYVRNDDPKEKLFFEHPETGRINIIPPGGVVFINTDSIPQYIWGRWSNKGRRLKFRIRVGLIVRLGRKADYGTAPYHTKK
jgi:hypothetical protein